MIQATAYEHPVYPGYYRLRTPALSKPIGYGVTLTLHRIDVDDQTVALPDGTRSRVPGTYAIYAGGVKVAGPYPTGTGIHILDGSYELAITVPTSGGPKTTRYPVTF